MSISYDYYPDGVVEQKARCTICNNMLLEVIWPNIPKKLKKELLKLQE
jgi:hypothetical protein